MKQDAVIQGKWFGVGAEWLDLETEKPAWPERAAAAWAAHLHKRVGYDREAFCRIGMRGRFAPINYAIWVFFPEDIAMSGHLFYIRKLRDNMTVFNYGNCRARKNSVDMPGYCGAGFLTIRSKYVLRKLAGVSSLFAPIWEDLKDISPDERGFYLAEAPAAGWLESIQPNEQRLYDAFRDGVGPAIAGMKSVDRSASARECLAAFERIQQSLTFADVESAFKTMVAATPEYWEFWESYATYCLDQDQTELACEVVKMAQKQYPECLILDRLGAFCCLKHGDWKGVVKHAIRYRELNPWDHFAAYALSAAAFEMKEYSRAAPLFEECAEHKCLSETNMINWGVALFALHRSEEALDIFMRVKERRPDSPQALNNVGMALASMGRADDAVKYCQQAVELDPAYRFSWDTLGFAHLKAGRAEEAIPAFLKAIELEPNYPDAWRHLLHAYDRSGQTEKMAGAKAWVGDVLPAELARYEQEKGTDIPD